MKLAAELTKSSFGEIDKVEHRARLEKLHVKMGIARKRW
jgi:hypothetical protein